MDTETKPLWSTTREAMGKTWTVALYPNNDALEDPTFTCDHGRFWDSQQRVNVNAKLLPESRDQTLLHELLHLADLFSRTKIQEEELSRLSQALYALLRGFGLWRAFPWPDKEPTNLRSGAQVAQVFERAQVTRRQAAKRAKELGVT